MFYDTLRPENLARDENEALHRVSNRGVLHNLKGHSSPLREPPYNEVILRSFLEDMIDDYFDGILNLQDRGLIKRIGGRCIPKPPSKTSVWMRYGCLR
tara:strand:+ start:1799 stop:2092 length:294 start_codon:yes stop_codon:yes gene_type:complete